MSALASELLRSRKVLGPDGKEYELTSETSAEQGEFLAGIARAIDAKVCLEVGLAFGISALYVCDAIAAKPGAKFVSIDTGWYGGIGLHNLERAGFRRFVEYHEGFSQAILPGLAVTGLRLDFAYVDSTKVFDALLVDAYFISRMLNVGGVMAFDDCRGWPGPKRLARYLARWPHLKVYDKFGTYKLGWGKIVANTLARLVPPRLLADDIAQTETQLAVNGNCVAFQKVAEDSRNWDWHSRM